MLYFILPVISILMYILLFSLFLHATKKVRTLSLELEKKTKALDEAYEVLAGNKTPTCEMTGHELVKLKRRVKLLPNQSVEYDKGVSIYRKGLYSWEPTGLTGTVINTKKDLYPDTADLEIAYCIKCSRAIPCPPLQIELLQEYKNDKSGNSGETERI